MAAANLKDGFRALRHVTMSSVDHYTRGATYYDFCGQ